jgi:DNA repair protein SbcD/Mre11
LKFLHTADWHLGRQFHNVSLLEDQALILEQLVDLARKQKVDAVVIAGDVYDRAIPPADAVALLNDTLEQMVIMSKIPVIMIAGNHDSPERLSFGAKLLAEQGFHVFGPLDSTNDSVVLSDEYGEVHFCAFPYAEPSQIRLHLQNDELSSHNVALSALVENTRTHLPKKSRSVAIGHCWVTGGQISDSERPISVGGASDVERNCFSGFSYTALGHLHQPQSAGKNIQYSGSLLKYSFSEVSHKKSVSIVELDELGQAEVDRVELTPHRDVRIIEGKIKDLLAGPPRGESADDYLLVRLTDRHAILDAVGKLRQVYPNVLHLERPGLLVGGSHQTRNLDHRNRSEFDLFKDFFAELTNEPMVEGSEAVFNTIVEALRHSERESI